ncbi:glycosyl transferase [Solibacillus sp. R5-41]|uniref:glycosyltransferase n=1 Tax=Solibacillus sp. R5-41 TaxID=2048654 RepID=UPI000C125FA8|nr:glycosyltransferase [Solibacillus sp. R5-41]ATP40606.1 glycosyl transferase [Solibacillus sp. R5-41]
MSKKIAFICSVESYKLSEAHIFKDLCLVPILLGEYLNYDVTIVTSEFNESVLHQTFPFVKFQHIPFEGSFEENMNAYLKEHAQEIDIAFAIGPYPSYLSMLKTYKQYNPNGKIYMKLDVNRFWLSRLMTYSYFEELLHLCDLVTSECEPIQTQINSALNLDVKLIPNGYYEYFPTVPVSFEQKKNRILTVGRLDAPEKQIKMAVTSFLAAELADWEFRLVGPMSEKFRQELHEMLEGSAYADQVIILGPIYDKYLLEQEYRLAKIFCLTSTVECHAHVFAEAAKNGCYIISTNVDGASDITQNQRFGKIHPTYDWEHIGLELKNAATQEQVLSHTCDELQKFARTELNWKVIVKKIAGLLDEERAD